MRMVFFDFSCLYFLCGSLSILAKADLRAFSKEDTVVNGDDLLRVIDNLDGFSEKNFRDFQEFKIDSLSEVGIEDMDLADIMQLSNAKRYDIDKYTKSDKMEFVDLHNIYRSNQTKPIPKGSDIQYVEWNNTLAWAAGDYLKQCAYKHGFGKNDNMTGEQGQNLYSGPSMSPSRPMYLWYKEYKFYYFNNLTCQQPHNCKHFVQLLWHDSQHIGCARRSYCFPKDMERKLVNCHYYHYGNAVGSGLRLYRYGWPCTRCTLSDGNLCFRNMCVNKRMCAAYNLNCECKLNCKNCAKPNPKMCRCESCKLGWDWEDCSYPCLNFFDVENKMPKACEKLISVNPICAKKEYRNMCRMQCGACKAVDAQKREELCCGGKICPQHYVLDESCECKLDCPSPLCMYPPSTTTKSPLVQQTKAPQHKFTKKVTTGKEKTHATKGNQTATEKETKASSKHGTKSKKGTEGIIKPGTTRVPEKVNVQQPSSMSSHITSLDIYLLLTQAAAYYYARS